MSKLISARAAVERYVPDGSSVLMGAGLEAMIPFSLGHELIRRGRRELTLVAPISDILIDQLVGAGVASTVVAAWVGNVSAGSGYNFRRAVEEAIPTPLQVVDHTNFTLALALHAAALGVPFLPTYTALGTDVLESNPDLDEILDPFGGQNIAIVKALAPDVALLPVQRADEDGNSHLWGNLGVARDASRAARRVIVVAEEIAEPALIASDPNRTEIPGFLVEAVVHEPFGSHPSPCAGFYHRDHPFFDEYHEATRSREGFLAWLEQWVTGVADRNGYLERLGGVRRDALRIKESRPAATADFGL